MGRNIGRTQKTGDEEMKKTKILILGISLTIIILFSGCLDKHIEHNDVDISVTGDNTSWSQAVADTLYAVDDEEANKYICNVDINGDGWIRDDEWLSTEECIEKISAHNKY